MLYNLHKSALSVNQSALSVNQSALSVNQSALSVNQRLLKNDPYLNVHKGYSYFKDRQLDFLDFLD